MKKNKYDVIVVGAGPAGSICARDLSKKGYDVLLCEKRPTVGVPIRCGEAMGNRKRLSNFVSINEQYIETDIHGVIIHSLENRIKYDAENCGIMLDRTLFDQDLSRQAETAGAELCVGARVCDVLSVQNQTRGLKINYNGHEDEVRASLIVAADGSESLCGQWAGLNCRQKPSSTCSTIEFQIEGDDKFPNHLSFWTDYSGIDEGYVWSFPKRKSNIINIGCGKITPKLSEPNMQDVLLNFKKEFFPCNKIINIIGGSVPVSGNIKENVTDHFLI